MAGRIVDPIYVPLTVTVPAATTAAAPQSTLVALPTGTLEAVDLLIPPGHVGQTGIRFTLSGQQILPYSNVASWIIGDDIERSFALNIESSDLFRVVAFNVGYFPHSFYLRFTVRQLSELPNRAAPVTIIDNAAFN